MTLAIKYYFRGTLCAFINSSGAGAERELKLQQSQLCVCMYECIYLSMYAVTLQECNNYTRMRQAKPSHAKR